MEKHSKRWIETDERLQRITLELINVSDVDHVSVQAVCKHANINRSTFYEHYADVYDLLDKLEMKNRKRIMARYKPGEVAVFS
ncbi:MAG: TetR/AcrR family transcriptional regulator, partial [Lachnospiraceae bacterium]|nr:TetR/AcrR family transcriptional regulator [Lachnospiraceae bacterium]